MIMMILVLVLQWYVHCGFELYDLVLRSEYRRA